MRTEPPARTEAAAPPAAPEPPPARPVLRFVNVRKSFGAQVVFDGLNLTIPAGQTTVILGPSGSGKSVLLKHIVGLLRPDSGEVWFEETRIDTLPERQLGRIRLQVGFLFQMGALFDSMTVEQNVAFPLDEHLRLPAPEKRSRVLHALERVDMKGFEHRLPAELSGGQRKRVALARAIVLEPRVVLYDEPTTGLDPIRSGGINELVVRLKAALGVTGVVVTHDIISARKVADRVVMLLGGKVIAQGTFDELERSDHPFVQRFFASAQSGAAETTGDDLGDDPAPAPKESAR